MKWMVVIALLALDGMPGLPILAASPPATQPAATQPSEDMQIQKAVSRRLAQLPVKNGRTIIHPKTDFGSLFFTIGPASAARTWPDEMPVDPQYAQVLLWLDEQRLNMERGYIARLPSGEIVTLKAETKEEGMARLEHLQREAYPVAGKLFPPISPALAKALDALEKGKLDLIHMPREDALSLLKDVNTCQARTDELPYSAYWKSNGENTIVIVFAEFKAKLEALSVGIRSELQSRKIALPKEATPAR